MAMENISNALLPHIRQNKLGRMAWEKVLCRFTRNDYEPDIVFWPKEVATTFSAKQSVFPPPAFIVEILSDSTEQRDRGIKFEDYAYHGVQEYWIIDTEQASVEQYLHNGKYLLLAVKLKEGILHSEVITGFQLQVQDIFIDPLT
jgi:Uma2 family endonuclease